MLKERMTHAKLKLRALVHRRQLDRDLEDELEFHLAMREEKMGRKTAASGEARDSARRFFGNPTLLKERCRELWAFASLERLCQDVRYALRILRANPAFTTVAILSLALGIGANTAIFSLIDAILLRDLPVHNPGQLVELMPADPKGDNAGMSIPMLEEFERRQQVFSSMFAWAQHSIVNVATGKTFARTDLWGADGNLYAGLGARPLFGRLITPADVNLHRGAPAQVAVLGYDFWRNQLDGDPSAIGATIRIEDIPFEVIGVTRENFTGLRADTELAITVPITAFPLVSGQPLGRVYERSWQVLDVTARLKKGFTLAQAAAQLESLWPAVQAATVPPDDSPFDRQQFFSNHLVVKSAARGFTPLHKRFVEPLYVLIGIAGLVLLIACVNLASLLVSRAAARAHEIGVRVALGASRSRLARQLLTEAVVLSVSGAVLGFAVAEWGSRKLADFILSQIFFTPGRLNLQPDWRVLGFTAAVAILTGVLFGLAPALRATRGPVSLGASMRVALGRGRSGEVLIGVQIALSIVLLSSAGLFVRSLAKLRSTNPGFRTSGVLAASLYPKTGGYKRLDDAAYYRELTGRVARLPGVVSAGLSESAPPTNFDNKVSVEAEPAASRRTTSDADLEMFSPGVFQTLGMRLERGRDFSWSDDERAPYVAILSESLAKQLFPDGEAVGRHISVEAQTFSVPRKALEVIGVVSDARFWSLRERASPELYVAGLQSYIRYGDLLVRANIDPRALVGGVQGVLDSLGHEYAFTAWPLSIQVDRTLLQERLTAMFSAFFGGLALLLASIGLYGLMSYTVARRTREIGVRMALGAQRGRVRWMVLRQTLTLVSVGTLIGIPCALASTRLIRSQLFGLSGDDPGTLVFTALCLFAVGAVAGYLPARRATKIDPLAALREE
jgi:putative ABC transport system permease protein